MLRIGDGGKFYEKEFKEFYKNYGVAWYKTTPYTPQHNGITETMNMMLMKKARRMLNGAGLGNHFGQR